MNSPLDPLSPDSACAELWRAASEGQQLGAEAGSASRISEFESASRTERLRCALCRERLSSRYLCADC